MQTFKKLFFLLTLKERKDASILMILILFMAFLDTIGVASILPFMTVLVNPGLIESNFILIRLFEIANIFGVETEQQFLFALGLLVLILLIISLSFKSLTTYFQVKFTEMSEYSLAKRLMEGYLHQPYIWFLNRNSADLGKRILSEVSHVIGGGLTPLIEIVSKSTIAICLILLLIIADPKLALIVGFTLSIAYGLIYYFISSRLKLIGKQRLKNNELRFSIINEVFGASKEVKIGNLEKFYVNRFSKAAQSFAQTQATLRVLAYLPRYILEALAFGGILLIILYVLSQTGNFNNSLPVISLYVFTGYRLMPSLQQVYSASAMLTFAGPSLDQLYDDVKNLKPAILNHDENDFEFKKTITLKNINFSYPDTSRSSLSNIDLIIPSKKTIGLIGPTGSGKTTIINIILGLLEAKTGSLNVDEKVITKQNLKSWQKLIGYVPQNIYLSDNTIAENIAFGIEPKEIDYKNVEKVSNISKLHDFVIDELPLKYKTIVGERGVKLSGGQRQRIGIARALYHNPQVLVLDEATNSLDNQTQKAVMDAINSLSKNITIILIAHRLETLKNCDTIFKLEKGNLTGQGTFSELFEKKF
jgi:ABC-type bacteriocin/lantibiotic exporter with double-glycine peptidase domain